MTIISSYPCLGHDQNSLLPGIPQGCILPYVMCGGDSEPAPKNTWNNVTFVPSSKAFFKKWFKLGRVI